jgi:hypothetical protein
LRRRGLNKLSALEPAEPVRRYEREKAGELIYRDIKKLGRIGSVGHRITGRRRSASIKGPSLYRGIWISGQTSMASRSTSADQAGDRQCIHRSVQQAIRG